MKFTTRYATMEDLDMMVEIEEAAMPGYANYLRDVSNYFFNECPGKISIAEMEDGTAVGIGRYSTLPDGSGWLETLRVDPAYQRLGAGRAIYGDYIKQAKENNAPHMGMFTGSDNVASKTLAQLHDFDLAGTYENKDYIPKDEILEINPDFKLVESLDEVKELFEKSKATWYPHIPFNRTFYRHNDENYKWFIEEKTVYTDGENLIVLGARMLHERGIYIGLMYGDMKKLVDFAVAKATNDKEKRLTCICPNTSKDALTAMKEAGFKDSGELIVMEWNRD